MTIWYEPFHQCAISQTGPALGRKKEMFYLTTHSAHFIYGYNGVRHMVKDHSGRKEGNVLFNDALSTFYLRLYGVIHNIMVKDHSYSE